MTEKLQNFNLEFLLHKSKVLNANKGIHYRAKAPIVKMLRETAYHKGLEEIENNKLHSMEYYKVTTYVHPPTRRRIDPPNLSPTTKALIDGLTDSGLWIDDDFSHLLETSFKYGGLSNEKDFFKFILNIQEISLEESKNYVLSPDAIVKG